MSKLRKTILGIASAVLILSGLLGFAFGTSSGHPIAGVVAGVGFGLFVSCLITWGLRRESYESISRGEPPVAGRESEQPVLTAETWRASTGSQVLAGMTRWGALLIAIAIAALLLLTFSRDAGAWRGLQLFALLTTVPLFAYAIWWVCTTRALREFRIRDGIVELATGSGKRRLAGSTITVGDSGYGIAVIYTPQLGPLGPYRYYFGSSHGFVPEVNKLLDPHRESGARVRPEIRTLRVQLGILLGLLFTLAIVIFYYSNRP